MPRKMPPCLEKTSAAKHPDSVLRSLHIQSGYNGKQPPNLHYQAADCIEPMPFPVNRKTYPPPLTPSPCGYACPVHRRRERLLRQGSTACSPRQRAGPRISSPPGRIGATMLAIIMLIFRNFFTISVLSHLKGRSLRPLPHFLKR